MFRAVRVAISAALALAGTIVALPTADACACGAVFVPAASSSKVPTEDAVVSLVGGREEITMKLRMNSTATEAGLVVPTPTPATVKLADDAIFTALQQVTSPVTKKRRHLFGGDGGRRVDSGAPAPTGASSVKELSTVNLGPLRATTLTANDPAALRTWLRTRGYVVRPQVQSTIDSYVAKGWAFVAMQLTPEGKHLDGDLPPITMGFASNQVIYPMQMSQAATKSVSVTTYVLTDHRVRRSDATAVKAPTTTFFAGRLDAQQSLPAALRSAASTTPYLTAIRQHLHSPDRQVVSDFTFARAASDEPYRDVIWEDDYLLTRNEFVLLIFAGGVLVAAGATALVWAARRRVARRV